MGKRALFALLMLNTLAGCPADSISAEDAKAALEEASADSQASTLVSASLELSTDFTIGQAVENAAQEIKDFIASQLPCARMTLENAKLTIEYGAEAGPCVFRGQTFSGSHTIEVAKNSDDSVIVKHRWDRLSNGRFMVSGDADVTWNLKDPSRHVTHHLTWTRLRDGRMGTGSGDRVQKPLAGGIAEGISVDGSRSWQGQRGRFELEINHIELRWADAVPQAGSLVLYTPADKSITLVFERVDADTIGVTASGGNRSFTLRVTAAGTISQR